MRDTTDIKSVFKFRKENEMSITKWILIAVASIVVLLSLAFGLTWLGIEWHGFFGPKHEAVRREVFKETRSYNESKVQQLAKYRLEFMRADDDSDKAAIASTVRTMFAEYDPDRLPTPELRRFLQQMMTYR